VNRTHAVDRIANHPPRSRHTRRLSHHAAQAVLRRTALDADSNPHACGTVARMADVPESVVVRAGVKAAALEGTTARRSSQPPAREKEEERLAPERADDRRRRGGGGAAGDRLQHRSRHREKLAVLAPCGSLYPPLT
jgi:hypothetical protein